MSDGASLVGPLESSLPSQHENEPSKKERPRTCLLRPQSAAAAEAAPIAVTSLLKRTTTHPGHQSGVNNKGYGMK